ncbi:hypothetical protein FKM82_018807, partial [Ascaphus truei]
MLLVSSGKITDAPEAEHSSEVRIVYERTPTPEQRALAERLLLPPTFFCYKNSPGYVSEESDVDDEDFDTAVQKLKGQLYPEELMAAALETVPG